MARFLGIEIGATTIRMVRVAGGVRPVAELYAEEPIPRLAGGLSGVDAALKQLGQTHGFAADAVAVSLPAGHTMVTRLALPFDDPKVIEQVLPAQLAGKVPNLDSQVVDFAVLGRTADPEEDAHDVLVAGYPIDVVKALLESIDHAGVDPHYVLPLSLAEHRAARLLYPTATGVWALLDLGARAARLTVMEGDRFVDARAMLVGSDEVTRAIGDALEAGEDTAERIKRDYGFVAPAGSEGAWFAQLAEKGSFGGDEPPDPRTLASAARKGLRPLVVAMRQSLASLTARTGQPVDRLVLAGGGARLRAIVPYLTQELGLDCEPVRLEVPELAAVAPNPLAQPEMVGALSMALVSAEALGGGMELNFRKGTLAYKGTLEFFRERALSLAVMAALLLAAVGFTLVMQYRALSTEQDLLREDLGKATEALFGSQLFDLTSIQTEIESAQGYRFLPERTAFDHFQWFSNAVTEQMAEIDFELEQLEIDTLRKVVSLKGDTGSDVGVPRLTSVLQQYECFPADIPEPQTQQTRGRVAFTLRIEADRCYASQDKE